MSILLRKIRNAPSRLKSVLREVRFVWHGVVDSVGEAVLIARRLRNTRIRSDEMSGTAVINAARSLAVSDVELYMAHLLSLRGVTVFVLLDDGILEHWDSVQVHRVNYFSPCRARWRSSYSIA